MGWVAGVDGCRAGWVVALAKVAGARLTDLRLTICPGFQAVLRVAPRPHLMAVDLPIGLLDRPQRGGRLCDREARARLGRRASTVFTPPSRRVLAAVTYGPARREGLSRQAFGILPKIREVDRLLGPGLQRRVREAHPELAFARLAGRPMRFNKKSAAGRRERLRALRKTLPHLSHRIDELLTETVAALPRRVVGPDDLLDALVLTLTALRITRGQAVCLPRRPAVDRRRLRMEIWY